jgi:uncharacterized membrane protein
VTRSGFMNALRQGLRGMPQRTIDETVADYEAHFAEGAAAGRSEAEVASALGDPVRLARELCAEMRFQAYEQSPNASGAAGAIAAFIGLGALDIILLLWVLFPLLGILLVWLAIGIAMLFAGAGLMTVGPFMDSPGGPGASVLAGVGVIAGSAAALGLLTLVSIGLVNGLVWYGRLHFKVLKPAMGKSSEGVAG